MDQFKVLDIYLENEEVLRKDIKIIENYFQNNKTENIEKLNFYLHQVSRDFLTIKNQQSFVLMSEKLKQRKMFKLEKAANEIVNNCESVVYSPEECRLSIDNFKFIASNNKITKEVQEKLLKELDFYQKQQVVLDKYHDEFRDSFDNTVIQVNSEVGKLSVGAMQSSQFQKVIQRPEIPVKQHFAFGGTLLSLIILLLGVYALWKKAKTRKKFYLDFFKVIKKSDLRIKVYGRVSNRFVKKYKELTGDLFYLFDKDIFTQDLNFYLRENSKVMVLDVSYYSKSNLALFYEESQSVYSIKLKKFVSEVEQLGGEVIFSTQIENLEVLKSQMTICLPR